MFEQKNVKLIHSCKINLSPENKILFLKSCIEECEYNIDQLTKKMLYTSPQNNNKINISDINLLNQLRTELSSLKDELSILEK